MGNRNNGFWGRSCHLKCPEDCQCCDVSYGMCTQEQVCLGDNNLDEQKGVSSKSSNTLIIIGIALITCSILVPAMALGIFCFMRRRSRQKAGAASSKDNNAAQPSVSYAVDPKEEADVEVSSPKTREYNPAYVVTGKREGSKEGDYSNLIDTGLIYDNPDGS